MAEYANSGIQVVVPNAPVIFTEDPVPCDRGFVRHRNGSGSFLLSGGNNINRYSCPCCRRNSVNYLASFTANISVPDTGTAGPISLGLAVDGTLIPSSVVTITPTVVDAYFEVSRTINVPIWNGCCQSLSVINTSAQDINVGQANIIISR